MSMDVRKVKLDFNRTFQYDIPSVQGDTGRSIEFQIMNGSVAEDITGENVKIFGLKPDGFRVFNNATITDAKAGKCTVDLTEQMLCVAGTLQCTLVRYKNGLRLSSRKFNIKISDSVADDIEIESTSEYKTLTEMLNSDISFGPEVETARGTYPNLNARFDAYLDMINVLKNRKIILSEVGCSTDETKATSNTTIIQNLLNRGVSFVVDKLYPINAALNLDNFSTKIMKGYNIQTGFLQLTDNTPILKVTKQDVRQIILDGLLLKFKNIQQKTDDYSDGYGIQFFSNNSNSNGCYHWQINNVRIENSYVGIGTKATGKFPIWGFNIGNLYFKNTTYQAINTMGGEACGQPNNKMDYVKIFNDDMPTGLNNYDNNYAIEIMGEWNIKNIDIESWSFKTIKITSGIVNIEQVHLEHMYIKSGLNCIQLQGNCNINNLYIVYQHIGDTSLSACWFWCYAGNYHLQNIQIEKHSSIATNLTKLQLISVQTTSECNIDLSGYNLKDDKTIICDYWENKVIAALNKYGRRCYYADSTPTAGSNPVGIIIYNNNWNAVGQPEGWICVEAGTPGVWKPFNIITE